LEVHVDVVRELYERSIVLRFKAFENEVSPAEVLDEKLIVTELLPWEMDELKEDIKHVEEVMEEHENFEKPKPLTIDATPAIDFSLFDEEEIETPKVQEPVVEILKQKSEEVVEVVVKEEPKQAEVHYTVAEPMGTANLSVELRKKFQTIEQGIKGQLGFSKLDSLVGSFGLNERLQYINELFDGSSESFSDAVKVLDGLSTLEEAKVKTNEFAGGNAWDLESETVDEFIQKIYRRYA
jgi:hypothetical protein